MNTKIKTKIKKLINPLEQIKLFIYFCGLALIASYLMYSGYKLAEFVDNPVGTWELAEVKVPKKERFEILPIKDLTVDERINKVLKERNFTQTTKFWCLLDHENATHDPFAYMINRHNDGTTSLDYGLLQNNDRFSPYKISIDCGQNVECTVNKFIDYINGGGNWNRWFGYKNFCQ